ncbi:MAG: hypothetical protein ICV87_03440, partial [Gemmatimonadetes bacterium]|nr:hypothetical protein [Gemmatimonadota bacterium]
MPSYEGHDDRWKRASLDDMGVLEEARRAVHADEVVAYRPTDDDPRRAR